MNVNHKKEKSRRAPAKKFGDFFGDLQMLLCDAKIYKKIIQKNFF